MNQDDQVIHCRQADKESHGKITHVTLSRLVCNRAHECRRRGICVLSDLAHPNVEGPGGSPDLADLGEENLYILQYRNVVGYFWLKVHSIDEARTIYNDPNRAFEVPRIVRRINYEKI